jgi:hypothetical protein
LFSCWLAPTLGLVTMSFKAIAAAVALLLSTGTFAQTQKAVYAHFMVCRIYGAVLCYINGLTRV